MNITDFAEKYRLKVRRSADDDSTTLYDYIGSGLDAHQLHLVLPFWREWANLEVSINGTDVSAEF